MANKKIQLQYLWTDESVMQADLLKKTSSGMTDWANEFYKRYGFQFDVQPADPKPTVQSLAKFALKKNDGVSPDQDRARVIEEKYDELRRPIARKIEDNTKAIASHERSITAKEDQNVLKKTEEGILDAQLASVPATDFAQKNTILLLKIAVLKQETALTTEITALRKQVIALSNAITKLQSDVAALYAKQATELETGGYEPELRRQMTSLFLNQKIGDEKRVNVVFCRFLRRKLAMRGLENQKVIGETFGQIGALIPELSVGSSSRILRQWLWPYPFIIVDIEMADPWTVAHEIVHAAGHDHPAARKLVESLEKRIRGIKVDVLGRKLPEAEYEEVPRYREVPGGYFDGAENDIMNYSAKGSKPADFVLADADKQRLDRAQFVVP